MSKTGYRQVCPWCHQPKANLTSHRQYCKQRPDAGTAPESPAPQPQAPQAETKARAAVHHSRKPIKKRILKAVRNLTQAAAKELVSAGAVVGDGGHCEREACPYRGLSSHLAKVRVQALVRGGLGIEAAARFVREQCG